jgi:K+-sensing histidine kinase KdpD
MYLWDANMTVTLAVTHADAETSQEQLETLEKQLFAALRIERQLLSAYMSFGGEPPVHSFTLPLRHGENIFGAVIGLREGEGVLVTENIFLEAFTAAVALNAVAAGVGLDKARIRETIESERRGAIVETAVTVNHEINNPLTAILGNVQLLLMKNEGLDEELKTKLKTIETAAMKIQGFTQKLLQMTTPRTVEYADGTNMLDVNGENKPDSDS